MLLYRRADRRVFIQSIWTLSRNCKIERLFMVANSVEHHLIYSIYEVIVRGFKYIINAAAHHSDIKDAIAPRATKLVMS